MAADGDPPADPLLQRGLSNLLWFAAVIGLLAAILAGRLLFAPGPGPVMVVALSLALMAYYYARNYRRLIATAGLAAPGQRAALLQLSALMALVGAALGVIWVVLRTRLTGAGPTIFANPWVSLAAAVVAFVAFAVIVQAAQRRLVDRLPQR